MDGMKKLILWCLAACSCGAAEVSGDAAVSRGDTVIDAILAVGAAVDAACAARAEGEAVTIVPLSTNDATTAARNAAANRELMWLCDKQRNVRWADAAAKRPSEEGGSHLWRRSGRGPNATRWWYDRLRAKRDEIRALKGRVVDIVMVGDSITHEWDRPPGDIVLEDLRRTYSVLNLGYGGDKFQQALWRVRNGELDGYEARCVTLLVGTNNSQEDEAEVAAGIGATVAAIREKQPKAKVMMMAIFPRCTPSQKKLRERSLRVTEMIRCYADGRDVFFCDFREAFLKPDDTGRFDRLLDGTHPGRTGLRVWRDLMLPYFERFTGKHHVPVDPVRKPFARRWVSYTADLTAAGSEKTAAAFVERAAKMGYTGVCLDAFAGCAAWGEAETARLNAVKGAAGLELVPVLHQAPDEAFAREAAAVERLLHPARWMVVTNGLAYADRKQLKEAVMRQLETIGRLHPGAERILNMKSLSGYGGGIPRDVMMVESGTDSYFRSKGWPIAVLGEINDPLYSLHYTAKAMRERRDDETDTAIYWTDIGDYRLMEDFTRLALKRE